MARIRTIKPDFFTSEQVVSLTPLARLLFIACWLEADRAGRLIWRIKTLKLRYLPGDDCNIEDLSDELLRLGLIVVYEIEGQQLAEIPTFKKHQVINNREADSSLPARVEHASTMRAPRENDKAISPLLGMEGNGREDTADGKEACGKSDQSSSAEPSVISNAELMNGVLDAYRKIHGVRPPGGPHLIQTLLKRVVEYPKAVDPAWWLIYFKYANEDEFLAGKKNPGFKADFQYLLKSDVFARVIEAAQRLEANHG